MLFARRYHIFQVPFPDLDKALARDSHFRVYRDAQMTETFSYRFRFQKRQMLIVTSQTVIVSVKNKVFFVSLFYACDTGDRLLTTNGTSVITFYSHWIAHLGNACRKTQSSSLL